MNGKRKNLTAALLSLILMISLLPAGRAAEEEKSKGLDLTEGFSDMAGEGWSWYADTKILVMDGAELVAEEGHAILLPDDALIAVVGDSAVKSSAEAAAIFGEGALTIMGPGKLRIESAAAAAVETALPRKEDPGDEKEEGQAVTPARILLLEQAELEVISAKGGIAAGEDLTINGGMVTITSCGDEGLRASGDIVILDGMITVETSPGEEEGEAPVCAVSAGGSLRLSGGRLAAKVTDAGDNGTSCAVSVGENGAIVLEEPVMPVVPLDAALNGSELVDAEGLALKHVVLCDGACLEGAAVPEDWYFDAMHRCRENGLADEEMLSAAMTRGEFIMTLYQRSGSRKVTVEVPFSDVEKDADCFDAVCWGVKRGIVNGCGDGKFHPGRKITPGEMAAMILRGAAAEDRSGSVGPFTQRKPFSAG